MYLINKFCIIIIKTLHSHSNDKNSTQKFRAKIKTIYVCDLIVTVQITHYFSLTTQISTDKTRFSNLENKKAQTFISILYLRI